MAFSVLGSNEWKVIMPFARKLSMVALCSTLTPLVICQQPTSPQAVLTAALVGLGATGIQSTNLSGQSDLIVGSTDESGSFTAQCSTNGFSQLQLQFPSHSRTESRAVSNGISSGTWIDKAGVSHSMSGHNVLTPESWFCPHILLSRLLMTPNLNLQLVGPEAKDGTSVIHISIAAAVPDNSPSSVLMAHLTKADLYLDSQTLRPIMLTFDDHPDNSATIDLPVEIRFSNFANANGVLVPYAIEKYVNSTLALKLQIESAAPSVTAQLVQ